MRTQLRTSLLVVVVLAAVAACVMPNVTITDPSVQATLQAITVEAAVRGTQQALGTTSPAGPSPTASVSPSPTATLVPSLTPTLTLTPTPIVINTPTPLFPMISVSVPTNCRAGPGKAYPLEGALLVDETAQVLARDPTGRYWYIPNPDSPGHFCWVWDEYATFTGFTGALPIYTPPPTPTPSFTPTPAANFTADYDGFVWCSGSWWIEISLKNTGPLAFRSMEIVLRDLDLETSESLEANEFVDKPSCSSSSSKLTLEPGETRMVSSPALNNDPSGHKLRARVTLCSKTNQEGVCVTQTINFKP